MMERLICLALLILPCLCNLSEAAPPSSSDLPPGQLSPAATHMLTEELVKLFNRFSHDPNAPEYLENAVPCLDRSIRYRKRPTSLVKVASHLSIISFHELSAQQMDLTAEIYLWQRWQDLRCSFKPVRGQGSTLLLYSSEGGEMSHPGLANLWHPDTHVLNAKETERPETVTKIKSSGYVETRTRLAVVLSCPMDLRLFPMDRQMCSLVIQSSAHSNKELTYFWKYGTRSTLSFVQGLDYQDRMTPDIRLVAYRFRNQTTAKEVLTSMAFDQIAVDVFLERPLGYFLWEVYMPATFIVVISFSSFWLDRSATPARVSLGVTTVLTITTLMSSANVNLPATAYPKSIGVFLAGCFVFTFLAFLEYSAASYLERRRSLDKIVRRAGSGGGEDEASAEHKISAASNGGGGHHRHQQQRRFTLIHDFRDPLGVRPSAVDVYSRAAFPLAFLIFHVVYWSATCLSLDPLPGDVVLLVRE